ncbi:hypothetical protein LEP1GSC036_1917 [Leptospira weilii str. 2006001853]|uniref:Uncharacterized protein n=1 Tax=Leptospira weilii str. 2006001853 TaxID=1001589 RepID=A0A828YVR4_9LEPT|nr:hypothetical protein LEP1GSC036_1917 [Leptospira weilii str. 2006001853]
MGTLTNEELLTTDTLRRRPGKTKILKEIPGKNRRSSYK